MLPKYDTLTAARDCKGSWPRQSRPDARTHREARHFAFADIPGRQAMSALPSKRTIPELSVHALAGPLFRPPQPPHHAGREEIDAGDEQQPEPEQPAVWVQKARQ